MRFARHELKLLKRQQLKADTEVDVKSKEDVTKTPSPHVKENYDAGE